MAHRTLLRVLDDLSSDELRAFAFYLPELPGQPTRIPRGKLDNADRVQLAELLLKYYPGRELEVAAKVLYEVPRRDLLKKYLLQGQEGAPTMDASPEKAPAAGSHTQGQPLPVSEKPREPTSRMASLAETTPAARRVSEKDLMKLARNLGKNWRAIGIEYLGVEASRLEQIEEENPGNAVMRNFYMLKSWKNGATGLLLFSTATDKLTWLPILICPQICLGLLISVKRWSFCGC
ncbi:uncharacterized protein LOC129346549 [Eublepharis macularius]|uniref:Uncharacterized protein LOC129346549 n=1 Tax=Eublepharis macularius TaxID=481883 RepID=A0AA97LLA6_EUBMA|nr:uncharacterized protein LOC129346549 [Eublepharis macularius]